jgi:hypothetical protein
VSDLGGHGFSRAAITLKKCGLPPLRDLLLPQSLPDRSRVPRRRWRIAFLLALGVLVNFFDRINLSVSRDALHVPSACRWSPSAISLAPFSWTYAAMQMPAGVLLDRLGSSPRRAVSARSCGALPLSPLPFPPASIGFSELACSWASANLPRSRRMPRPWATGLRARRGAWPRPSPMRRQNSPAPSEFH